MKLSPTLVLLISIFAFTLPAALADDADIVVNGSSATASTSTTIRMNNEHVELTIHTDTGSPATDTSDAKNYRKGYGSVKVTYEFENTSNKQEKVSLGFPEECSNGLSNECEQSGEILHDLKLLEKNTSYKVLKKDDTANNKSWYASDVTFNPHEKKTLITTYWVRVGTYKSGSRWMNYTLSTGATWKDSIGEAKIDVTFLSPLDDYLIKEISPAGFTFSKDRKKISWDLKNIEPTEQDNIRLAYTDFNEPVFGCEIGGSLSEHEMSDYASSWLPTNEKQNLFYFPCAASDRDTKTAWVEGASGNGTGEWIKLDLNTNNHYESLEIRNGYGLSKDLWKKNNRVKKATLEFSNGKKEDITLKDKMDWQRFVLKKPVDGVTWVKLTIKDVYKGTKYNDTAISEINMQGLPIDANRE